MSHHRAFPPRSHLSPSPRPAPPGGRLLDSRWGRRVSVQLSQHPPYLWILLLGLAANMFSGYSHYLGVPLSPDRVLVPFALVLMVLDRDRLRLRWDAVHTLMVVFVGWTLVSMIWFGNLLDSTSLFALLDRTLIPFILFATAPLFFDTPQRRGLLLKFLTLIGLGLGLLAILEIAAPQLVFPPYIANPDVGDHFGRARGPFVAGDALGVSVLLCGFAAVLLARRSHGRWRRLAVVVAPLSVVAAALSLTRSVWVGGIVAIVVGAALVPRLRARLLAGLAVTTALVIGAILAVPALQEAAAERLGQTGPIYDRLGSSQAALGVLADYPLTGIGWRRFYPGGADWVRQSDLFPMNSVVIEIHNVPLSRAAELGIPAAVVLALIMLLGPGRTLVRRPPSLEWGQWRILAGAAFALWFVTGLASPMAIPFPNNIAWLLAGVATAPWALLGASGSTAPGTRAESPQRGTSGAVG